MLIFPGLYHFLFCLPKLVIELHYFIKKVRREDLRLLYGFAIVTVVGAPTLPAYRDTLLDAPASTVLRTPFGRWKYMTAESPGFKETGPLPTLKQSAGFPPNPSTSILMVCILLGAQVSA